MAKKSIMKFKDVEEVVERSNRQRDTLSPRRGRVFEFAAVRLGSDPSPGPRRLMCVL
jgi:hypothetical protein